MASSSFNLRNIDPKVMFFLKKEAAKQKKSINSLILHFLEQGLGLSVSKKKIVFHDLDSLAGTWDEEDKKTFDENIKSFEGVDKEFWT